MGKASQRRQLKRAEFLAQLAMNDPARFTDEWSKRLESWSREANHNISVLVNDEGHTTVLNADLVRYAEDQLVACGPKAYDLEATSTQECLANACAVAFAKHAENDAYKITSTGEICHRAKLYRKPTAWNRRTTMRYVKKNSDRGGTK